MSSPLFQIEKLDSENYDSWNVQMKSILIHQELWKVVSGVEVKPDDEMWKSKDEKALATIVLSIKANQINSIKHCKSSAEAWLKLKEIYQPTSPGRKVTLFKKLLNLKMSENEDSNQFLNSFSNICEKLCEINVTLNEEILVIILLSSLPSSYENFVVAFETRDDLPTLNQLKIKLNEEAERRKRTEASENDVNTVSIFNARSGNHNNKNRKSINVTNSSGKYIKNVSSSKHNFNCFNCGRSGHYAKNCRNKVKQNNSNAVLSARGLNNFGGDTWCIDSGATAHMCCDRNLFVKFKEHREQIFLPGNGTIYSVGTGSVRLKFDNSIVSLENVLYVPDLLFNFISVSKAAEAGFITCFENKEAKVQNKQNKQVLFTAKMIQNLYICNAAKNRLNATSHIDDIWIWHNRYGHLNFNSLNELKQKELVIGFNMKNHDSPETPCTVCLKSKISALPFSNSTNTTNDVLEVIHSDVCGPIQRGQQEEPSTSSVLLTTIRGMLQFT